MWKAKGVVVLVHAIKEYGKVEVQFHALTSTLDGATGYR